MTEIRFYHLQTQTMEEALPSLLLKAYASGKHIIVKHDSDKILDELNERLWTFHANQFLPHGTKKDGHADLQPIWLTSTDDNPNNAKILVLSGGATHPHIAAFDLCCELFDGQQDDAVTAARSRWKDYKNQGFDVTYWQQTDRGGWEQKA